jgi:hypothetical protein
MREHIILFLRGNVGFLILISVLVASLGFNVQAFRRRLPPSQGMAIGTHLPVISTINAKGKTSEMPVIVDGRPTVLYVMRPDCHWCAANLDNIRTLARSAGSRYRFVGLSMTTAGLDEYVAATPLPFPIFAIDMHHLNKGFSPKGTPTMLVVGQDAIVKKIWTGALAAQARSMADVQSFFQVTLPGFVTPAPAEQTVSTDTTK